MAPQSEVQSGFAIQYQLENILANMTAKLRAEILIAAIAGFEDQKKRIDAKITDLRQVLGTGSADGATGEAATSTSGTMPARRNALFTSPECAS